MRAHKRHPPPLSLSHTGHPLSPDVSFPKSCGDVCRGHGWRSLGQRRGGDKAELADWAQADLVAKLFRPWRLVALSMSTHKGKERETQRACFSAIQFPS